jgi:hypothetical protein
MKNLYALFFLCLLGMNAQAQNLLNNGSFEIAPSCPATIGTTALLTGWNDYTTGSPDCFNICGGFGSGVPANVFGSQTPAHGDGYIGLVDYWTGSDYREYAHSAMTAMTIGTTYEVSMSVSLCDISAQGSNGLGVYFFDLGSSTYPTPTTNVLPITPQVSYSGLGAITDQTNWVRLSGTFTADSAYDNIVIGGFVASALCATSPAAAGSQSYTYYYIDSVVVKAITGINFNFTQTDFCSGGTINAPFTISPGAVFNSGNIFTLQLSNATGSFTAPTNIGSLTGTSGGTITGTLPATASGTGYRLRIVSSNLADTSSKNTVDIRITPAHTITGSSNSPLCEGDTLFLNSTASVTGVSYLWNGPNAFSDLNQNTYIAPASVSQSGKYAITTAHNACLATDTVTVVVKPKPAVTTSSNSPVCPGTTMQLNANSNLPGSTFSWAGPNSFTSSVQNPTRFPTAYADQGIYTVFATKDGCTTQKDMPVSVQITTATPVGSSNSPVCEDFSLDLGATCATPGASFNWAGPYGYTSLLQNPSQIATLHHNGNFLVWATVNGCVSLPDTVKVMVYPKPYLGNYASPNDTVCENTVVTFVTVPMNGVINPIFQWFKNNVAVPGANALTLISPYATGDTFYCRTFCEDNCGHSLTLYSNKVGMTVLPIVNNLSATISSVPAQPLPGQPVTFRAIPVNGGYNPQYQWQKNGKDVWSATYAIWSTDKLAPYDKVNCIVTTSDPCANTTIVSSDTMEVNFPTSVGEVNNDDIFGLYPNPNDGSFKLKMQNIKCKSIDVINVSGQVVYQLKPGAPQVEYTIHMPQQLPSGTYMLRVYDGTEYYRKSFTVNK